MMYFSNFIRDSEQDLEPQQNHDAHICSLFILLFVHGNIHLFDRKHPGLFFLIKSPLTHRNVAVTWTSKCWLVIC